MNSNYAYHDFLFKTPGNYLRIIEETIEQLRPHVNEFDTIAFRGMSGAMVAPMVAMRLNKGITIIRKGTENSHAPEVTGIFEKGLKYIILDDFISSGNTVLAIKKLLSNELTGMKLVGLYLYRDRQWISHLTGECYARYLDK